MPTESASRRESGLALAPCEVTRLGAETDRTGKVVGHYRVVERIGGGGMGEVYRAEDLRLGRTVALKFLSVEMARDPEALSRFYREARAASALDHPGICAIHDISEVEGVPFLVMEYLEGRSLKSMVEEHPLDLDLLLDLGIQIGDALDAAHRKGILHRDVKPGNIFVTGRGQAKLLDFGLARWKPADEESRMGAGVALAEGQAIEANQGRTAPGARAHGPGGRKNTVTGMIAGTAEYMSPEQARGEDLDVRSDIYSFCVVLYEMAAGREPFSGDTSSVIRYAILHREPKPLRRANPALPPELERVIARGMEKERDQRYATMADLLVELKRVRFYRESAELAEAIPLLPPPPMRKSRARGVRVWLAIASVALLLAAAAMIWDLKSRTAARLAILSLAVVPFEADAASSREEYLSDGIAKDIADSLARIQGFGIVSRVSAFRLESDQRSWQQAARLLGAESLLTGRLRARGDDVELQLDLVLARDGSILWSGEYRSRREDLPGLAHQVARAIAQGMRVELSASDSSRLSRPTTASSNTYELYLRGCRLQSVPTLESLRKADDEFRKATESDENFALAYLARAELWLEAQDREYVTTADALENSRPNLERALALDSGLGRAHLALANLKYRLEWDWSSAGEEFHQAVSLDSNDSATHRWYSRYLGFLGRYDDSMAESAQAARLDPLDPEVHLDRGLLLLGNREYARAADELRAALNLDPALAAAHLAMASVHEAKGDCRAAETERIRGYRSAGLGELAEAARNGLEAAGCRGAAQKALEVLLRSPGLQSLRPALVAGEYARSGDREKAIDWLERAFRARAAPLLTLRGDEGFAALRTDSRFQNLLRGLKPPE